MRSIRKTWAAATRGPKTGFGAWLSALLAAVCMGWAGPAASQAWMVTLLDGEASVVDGTRRLAAAPGLPLETGALIDTGPKTALLRLEGPGGSSIDLGPDTRVMLLPGTLPGAGGRAPALYLLQGWVKGTAGPGAKGTLPGLASEGVDVMPFKGSAVLQVDGSTHHVFAEAGALQVNERRRGGESHTLRGGQFYTGDAGRSGVAEPRPPGDWLSAVPRTFRDPLPLRADALRGRAFQPTLLPGPTHAQLAPWLEAERYVRRSFTRRFASLARDPDFRQGLRNRLRAHPEWGVILDPPPPAAPTPPSPAPAATPPAVAPRTAP
jgi:hypothetical protein